MPSPDPVNLTAPRILHRRDLFVEDAAAQVRHLDALHLIARNGREIDVQQRFAGEIFDVHNPANQALEARAMTLEMLEIEASIGDGDAGYAGRQALHRRRHSS